MRRSKTGYPQLKGVWKIEILALEPGYQILRAAGSEPPQRKQAACLLPLHLTDEMRRELSVLGTGTLSLTFLLVFAHVCLCPPLKRFIYLLEHCIFHRILLPQLCSGLGISVQVVPLVPGKENNLLLYHCFCGKISQYINSTHIIFPRNEVSFLRMSFPLKGISNSYFSNGFFFLNV